jgi:Zn-dependent protease
MDLSAANLVLFLTWFVAFLFSLTLHEAGHAWAAYKLGDPTAYHGGQVTLNPVPHIKREPLGTVLIPIITFFLNGWMMGWASAPYDPLWAIRHSRRAALMALAGPGANLLIAVTAGLVMRGGLALDFFHPPAMLTFEQVVAGDGGVAAGIATLVSILFTLNLLLFAFNLIPLPPLDGSSALTLLMSDSMAERYRVFLSQPMLGLIGLLIAWRLVGPVFGPIHAFAMSLIYPQFF